uniref:Uncharacterized protein n=1 Tax=Panagrolaimus sp. ES5 TaxID=591445 RepID=A0AC34F260_9BILA
MRQTWFPLFLYLSTILLITCLLNVEAEEWTPEKKMEWFNSPGNLKKAQDGYAESEKKKKEEQAAKDLKHYIYYGVIGGGSVSGILNTIFFILACKGIICKPKRKEINRTLDVL